MELGVLRFLPRGIRRIVWRLSEQGGDLSFEISFSMKAGPKQATLDRLIRSFWNRCRLHQFGNTPNLHVQRAVEIAFGAVKYPGCYLPTIHFFSPNWMSAMCAHMHVDEGCSSLDI